ncbi:hypothetical protein F5Y17DRAFT_239184 [Xylariaceae sp. FL0594]|nr:hypothetical protein F5Y17DRAFT_239184 [Xylariaceae sp. FL0594]
MFHLASFDIGAKSWAKASDMVRRLGRGRSWALDWHHAQEDPEPAEDAAVRRAEAARIRRERETLPVAVAILDDPSSVDRQAGCPLFTLLPAELRELIWEFALTRYEVPGTWYPIDSPCARPGQAASLRVAVELLLTCRAVYLETFLVPFRVNPLMVYDGHPDVVPPRNVLHFTPSNVRSCKKLRLWQFANITSLVLSVQQFGLEGGSLECVSRLAGTKDRHQGRAPTGLFHTDYDSFGPYEDSHALPSGTSPDPDAAENHSALVRKITMGKRITHLTLQLSRSDWWTWTSKPQDDPHERLRLEPMMNLTARRDTASAMERGCEARKEGRQPDFDLGEFEKQSCWGMQFAEHWPDLQRLELALEVHDIKEDQLDSVIRCAKLWTFPLGQGSWLEWDGVKESVVRWRGAHRYPFDEALGVEWVSDRVPARQARKDNTPLVRWRPETEERKEGQEFVIKSLVFKRRCNPGDLAIR